MIDGRDREEAHAALFASIARTPIATLITDHRKPDYPIVAVNEAFLQLTGYTRDEVLGRNCRFLQGPDTEPEAREAMREAVAKGDKLLVEITNYRKNGAKFRNAVMIAPLFDSAGRLAFYVGSQMDLREARTGDRRTEASRKVEGLTGRQRDVLELMTGGLRNKQIAGKLGIDETTVKMHRARLLERLEVQTSADAIRIGVEAGL